MAQLTADTVRSLAKFRAKDAPVTTCYLDLDGRVLTSHKDLQKAFDTLVRQAQTRFDGQTSLASVTADLDRMARHVKGYRRSHARALAMFSCSSAQLWEVHELPSKVTNQLVVHPSPCVRQLEEVVEEHVRSGVLLADKQRARMFVYEMGELVDHTERFDTIERHGEDNRGELYKTRQVHQVAEQVQQHLRRAAQLAFAVYQEHGFDRLLLGAPSEIAADLVPVLHPYLRDRLVEEPFPVTPSASIADVRAAALAAEERLERQKERADVARLRETVAAGGRAVLTLAEVLAALNAKRAERIVVSQGFGAEGWRCPGCGGLFVVGRTCPVCGTPMVLLDDVVEEAVHESLAQDVRVYVCVDNADLDVAGGIGAYLRF